MSLAGQHIGRYRLLHLLDDDGLYIAQDIHIERQVVIRVRQFADREDAEDAAHLFLERVRAIASLDHPAIVPIYDFGRQNSGEEALFYIVFTFYQDGSLADWLQRCSGPLLPQNAAPLIERVADALHYVHEKHIVHQYVTPAHLLVRSRKEQSDYPELFLTGFELAAPPMPGNPLYMAPEQWSDQAVAATDQYALGVIAYRLLTGVFPFEGSAEQIREQHLHLAPLQPSKRNGQLPASIDAVLLRALAKEPTRRFPSIAAFASALAEALQVRSSEDFYSAPTLNAENTGEAFGLPPDEPTPKRIPVHPSGAADAVHDGVTTSADDDDITVRDITIAAAPDELLSANLPAIEQVRITPVLPDQAPRERADRFDVRLRNAFETSVAIPIRRLAQAPLAARVRSSDNLRKILLLVLAFLVIVASGGLLYLVRVNQLVTDGVQATATASIRSLATSYAATVTVQASATAATERDPYPPGKGTLVFNDPLTSNRKTTWNQVAGECSFTNGSYEVDASDQGMNYCDASPTFTNFTYQVQMTITVGDAGGIVFRVDNAKSTYYYFAINTKGNYWLYYYNGSYSITILNGSSQAIHAGLGQSDLLAVVVTGRNIDLYVNNQHLAGISDGIYTSGLIGVAAEDDGDVTTVTFNNARVWNI